MDFSQYSVHYGELPMPQQRDPYSEMNMMRAQSLYQRPDIRKFMHDFNDKTKEHFNKHWFERNDEDLIEGMKQIILSCERDRYFTLKVLGFEVIMDYETIQLILYNYYNSKTKNGKKIDNDYDYINLKDSDIMLLKVLYYVKLNTVPEKSDDDPIDEESQQKQKDERTEGQVEIYIALPRYVNKYYFRILGNYYSPLFQIVDGSTYNNATSNSKVQTVTLKTNFMPIKIYKQTMDVVDIVDGIPRKGTIFTSYIFSKKTDAILFLLGRYGFYGALEFLELSYIFVLDPNKDELLDTEKYYHFYDDSKKIIVAVSKLLFDKDLVTQSFVCTILRNCKQLQTVDEIYDPRYWVITLGANFKSDSLEKGIPVLDSFESIYDIRTKNSIRLPIEDKADSYRILRWIIREFNFLRARDNVNISTKHPRMADEYIPAIYAMKISKNLYRISDKGKKINFKDILRVIDIAPDYILKNINSANLVDYVNLVNDNDAELALSFTYKGISGLGDTARKKSGSPGVPTKEQKSSSAVPLIYRSVHPSHLGKIDLDSSTASDPGLSGIICPMAKIHEDGSFSGYQEPNEWKKFYMDALAELKQMYNVQEVISLRKKMGLTFDYVKEALVQEAINSYQKLIPSIVDPSEIPSRKKKKQVIVDSDTDDEVGKIVVDDEDPFFFDDLADDDEETYDD